MRSAIAVAETTGLCQPIERLIMKVVPGLAFAIAFIGLGIAQMVAGFSGIEHVWGSVWAWLALVGAVGFGFTLPMTIGAYFGATEVWGWSTPLAIAFAAPGLLFMVPGLIAAAVSKLRNR